MAQKGDETILDEAKSLLVQGKRFMALEDFQSATDSLEQSCQLFDAYYGVAKRECADAYLEYGLALVALANLEAGTGTDKIMKKAGIEGGEDGMDDDDDEHEADDEDEEQEDEDEEQEPQAASVNGEADKNNQQHLNGQEVPMDTAQSENAVSPENTNGVSSNNNQQPQQSSTSTSDTKDNQDPQPGTSSDAAAGPSGAGPDEDETAENEEATTIEIAWEVLCLAKRLFMTDESMEGRLKLAETLQKIGEISIEWDNNDNAVSILEECLTIRKAILPADDRLIALTYYHLGLAHSFKSETQNANENFQNAINVIEKRIASLSEDLDKAKQNQDTVAASTYQKEINELKELLPDMTMRLDDSKEDSIKSNDVLKRTREEMQLEDEEAKKVCADKSKPVDDISHLVKRKAA